MVFTSKIAVERAHRTTLADGEIVENSRDSVALPAGYETSVAKGPRRKFCRSKRFG